MADRAQLHRAPDAAVLVARTRFLASMEAFKQAIKRVLAQNSVVEKEVRYEGQPAATRIQIRFAGATAYAQRKLARILGPCRQRDG
eukprot:7056213-Pyramimonas_sp.AAC.1